MKSEIEKIYLIDRFLKGELSGLALDEFKNKLRNDKQFAEEVESQKAIIEGIKLARREHLISVLKGETTPLVQTNFAHKKESKEPPSTENTLKIDPEKSIKSSPKEFVLKPNYNNWYFIAAGILFLGFFLYLIFGYYIPHQKLQLAQKDSIPILTPESMKVDSEEEDEPELVKNPFTDDTTGKVEDDLAKIDKPLPKDSISVEKDKKISETIFSVSAFELVKAGTDNGTNAGMGGETGSELKNTTLRKVRGTTVKVEYWQSVVNFKGYKLIGNNLKLFDVDTKERMNLIYLDNQLFLNKSGTYYKLNASGNFESYQKETDNDIIKLLENK
jgi:hypothetical protein